MQLTTRFQGGILGNVGSSFRDLIARCCLEVKARRSDGDGKDAGQVVWWHVMCVTGYTEV